MKSHVLTVSCQSTRGIVAAITGYLAETACNIVDSSQFDDLETGLFFMRLTFASEGGVAGQAVPKLLGDHDNPLDTVAATIRPRFSSALSRQFRMHLPRGGG